MNVENMLKLADFLDNLPEKKFDMRQWFAERVEDKGLGGLRKRIDHFNVGNECGTTACIAGWAATLAVPDLKDRSQRFSIEGEARRWLGLTIEQSCWLFFGCWSKNKVGPEIGEGTAKAAAIAVRKMAEIGGVPHGFEV